jgi:predicted transposase YbfD/YdcC
MIREEVRESFEDFIDGLDDPRIERNKLHSVEEILFLVLAAIVCGCEGWRDIERFGKIKLEFLRTVFPYAHGIPSDDTMRGFFRALDPENFRTCFVSWAKALKAPDSNHLSIDGKVSRRSFNGDESPLHMVTAFASDCRIVLAQENVSDKSNEITAIPKLLEILDLKGSIVTIDAMGCQREIAKAICEKGADYVLSLKGNQGNLHENVEWVFADEDILKELKVNSAQTFDKNTHGRIEERTYRSILIPEEIKKEHDWPYLKTLIQVVSKRTIKGMVSEETRYYISSLENNAEKIGAAIRSHWAIENSLHWILDVTFRDDDSRIRKGNAPQNIAVIKHVALNMLQKVKGKRDSIKLLRKSAGWDDKLLLTILSSF